MTCVVSQEITRAKNKLEEMTQVSCIGRHTGASTLISRFMQIMCAAVRIDEGESESAKEIALLTAENARLRDALGIEGVVVEDDAPRPSVPAPAPPSHP